MRSQKCCRTGGSVPRPSCFLSRASRRSSFGFRTQSKLTQKITLCLQRTLSLADLSTEMAKLAECRARYSFKPREGWLHPPTALAAVRSARLTAPPASRPSALPTPQPEWLQSRSRAAAAMDIRRYSEEPPIPPPPAPCCDCSTIAPRFVFSYIIHPSILVCFVSAPQRPSPPGD